ncbi:MAG: S8 family serine peptidase [Saprospiraceae bacterium]|nr:S8 family serine peptidase [Saprospiraceae bacterium]
MKNSNIKIASAFAAILMLITACQKEVAESSIAPLLIPSSNVVEGSYIVMFKSIFMKDYTGVMTSVSREEAESVSSRKLSYFQEQVHKLMIPSGIPATQITDYYSEVFYGVALKLDKTQLAILLKNPMVEFIEQDMEVRLPDITIEDSGIKSRAQTLPCGITNAGGSADGSTSTKWIWIADTGIDLDHPDLNVVTNSTYAKSFVGGTPDDCHGHGTHVAGTAAAKDNTIGVIGVSAGAPVVPVRVLNCQGSGQTSKILNGLNHIATYDEAGDVLNMSLGGYWGSNCATNSSYKTALTNLSNAGTRIALAAGNSSANASLYSPACVNATNIHTIASMTCAKAWSSFSNFGAPPIDWITTGSSVYSTYKNGGYATMSGTSMASPHVAGIMHSIQASPNQNGTVTFSGVNYKIAVR